MSITISALLAIAITSPTGEPLRELCKHDISERRDDLRCTPHAEGAPRYAAPVCCDTSACYAADEGYCLDDEELFYCAHGRLDAATEQVSCYFEVPNYCDVFDCSGAIQAPDAGPQEYILCCEFGVCTAYTAGSGTCEPQNLYACASPVSNPDGTVDCADWDE